MGKKFLILLLFVMLLFACIPYIKKTVPVLSHKNRDENIPILMYHRVSPGNKSGLGLKVTPDNFDKQLAYLKQRGYHTITLNQLINHWDKKTKLPSKPVIITFDDGYEDNFTYAYPILKKHGFNATIFLVYNEISGYNSWDFGKTTLMPLKLLSLKQILYMQKRGIDFQSHTLSHQDLSSLPPRLLRLELKNSKKMLEDKINAPVNFIAYPFGKSNSFVQNEVKKAGYIGGISTIQGKNTSSTDRYCLKRIRINGYRTFQFFKRTFQ